MRYESISPELFIGNRARLAKLLMPNSLAVLHANDITPTNADGTTPATPNSDLFYLTGVEQEQSILLLYPDAHEEDHRELLFLREPTSENQLWEGHKLSRAEARELTGIRRIHWLSEFPALFHRLICECGHVYLNTNEHKRAVIEVETRDARFVADTRRRYPLHSYQRLAPLMHQLRAVKSELEIALIRRACDLTEKGFRRLLRFTRPGVLEREVEAELSHEFLRHGGRFAYPPIIGSGLNACCLHYVSNAAACRDGELLLLDVGAAYANYNSDMTRTIPVNGRFTRRQRRVYDAVLRVLRQCVQGLTAGKLVRDWQKEAEQSMTRELVDLKLLTLREVKNQTPERPACKKYFMHGVGHPLGLDVHDVALTTLPIQAGWVMTVEPGIYIPEEGFAVRLENNVLITDQGPVDLMAKIPVEPNEIEALMKARPKSASAGNGAPVARKASRVNGHASGHWSRRSVAARG
jgi:Xaa-Pro aminopeptidase